MATYRPHQFLDNYGRPEMKLPYRSNDDAPYSIPLGPKNVNVTSPYLIGVIDIRWDNPTIYTEHSGLGILGVNVYRAYDSPEGDYVKINPSPIGALYYRDQTREQLIVDEDPMLGGRFIAGTNSTNDWMIKTYFKPLVVPGTNGKMLADNSKHVRVTVKKDANSAFVEVPAWRVIGETGEIYLINNKVYNAQTNKLEEPLLPDISAGGEVRVSYTYIDNYIQTDVARRIYYKVTTVAQDCEHQRMIETSLNQVEAISLYDMEKVDWIWAEAIRRNRWILEQGGERVKVFIRKWAGERCSCYDDKYRTSKSDCHVCFVPGTLINTELGWRPIETINVGDRVLSSNGKYNHVKATISRPYNGELISLTTYVNTNPIMVTPNHPFLVMRSTHQILSKHGKNDECGPICDAFIKRGDGDARKLPNPRKLPSGKWWARIQVNGSRGKGRISLGTYDTREEAIDVIIKYKQENLKPVHEIKWDEADNIKKKDWLVPQWNSDICDIQTITIPEKYLKKGKSGPERLGETTFEVNKEFLWVLGMYIAEGSNSKGNSIKGGGGSINFTLHRDEKEYQKKLIDFFKKYGYNPSLREHKKSKSSSVIVNSTTLGYWFPEWLGHLCYNKRIPQELMHLPEDKIWSLIQGIYDGDGSKRDKEITQTSEILSLQLVELLHRVGEQPLVRKQISKSLTPKGNKRRVAYCISWSEDSFNNKNRKNRWTFGDKVLAHVKDIKRCEYSGLVYNLEVEEDPTYIVNGIVVHNCYGTSYVGGYEGPYDILVAPPEAEKNVMLMDMGLHVSYDWMSWTGPYPLLVDRDVVIRQNNDRFMVSRVNPQGQRGAIFQQHFNLSPLDQNDPIYQIPIYGGQGSVPADWNAYRKSKPTDASPTIPNKPEIPDQYERRGRTVTFENITF